MSDRRQALLWLGLSLVVLGLQDMALWAVPRGLMLADLGVVILGGVWVTAQRRWLW